MNLFDKKQCEIYDDICFKHKFKKLQNQKYGYLEKILILDVNIKLKSTKDFLIYDTEPYDFKIKNGTFIYLLFIGEKGIPFTTLRKYSRENRGKYIQYKWYKIKIEGDKK